LTKKINNGCSAQESSIAWSQLADMNGDGLQDLVYQWRGSNGARGPVPVFYSEGFQFRPGGLVGSSFGIAPSLSPSIAETALSAVTVDTSSFVSHTYPTCW